MRLGFIFNALRCATRAFYVLVLENNIRMMRHCHNSMRFDISFYNLTSSPIENYRLLDERLNTSFLKKKDV